MTENIVTEKRNCLKPEKVAMLAFIKKNSHNSAKGIVNLNNFAVFICKFEMFNVENFFWVCNIIGKFID